jgi:heat shock protein HslJ
MRASLVLASALTVTLAVGACAAGTGTAGTPGATPATLDGRTFLATAITGRQPVAGTTIRITFTDGRIGVSAGCNSMAGPYRLDGGRLVAAQLATTDMGCDPDRMAQDAWLAEFLGAGPEVALDGDALALASGGTRITFLDREVADPDRPLAGTRWVLDAIVSGDAVSSVPAGVSASLRIVDGRLELDTGCNTGGGAVTVGDASLAFGAVTLTKRACPGPAAEVERAVTAVLTGEVRYTVEADLLTLDGGGRGLTFRASA